MLTLADAEAKHEKLKRQMRLIRRAIRTQDNVDGLAEQLEKLTREARNLVVTLNKQREMAQYLIQVEPYGGPQ